MKRIYYFIEKNIANILNATLCNQMLGLGALLP